MKPERKVLEDKFLLSRDNKAYSRTFLNAVDQEHSGSIKAELSIRKRRPPKSSKRKNFFFSVWGNIEIRDCKHRIDLTLEGGNRSPERLAELNNMKDKLRKIILVCQDMLDAIEVVENHKDFK